MKNKNAFTLVELLVVIAIIGLLISLLIPAIQAARESARRSRCAANMKQMALGMLNYHDTHKSLPPGNLANEALMEQACHVHDNREGERKELQYCGMIGWPVFILPFTEQSPLYEKVRFDLFAYAFEPGNGRHMGSPHGSEENREVVEKIPSFFKCPSGRRDMTAQYHKDYAVSSRDGAPEMFLNDSKSVFHCNSATRIADLKRGSSNILMMLELASLWWWSPNNNGESEPAPTGNNPFFWVGSGSQGYVCCRGLNPHSNVREDYPLNSKTGWCATHYARSYHPGGANAAMCDGSAMFLSEKIDIGQYVILFERDGENLAMMP